MHQIHGNKRVYIYLLFPFYAGAASLRISPPSTRGGNGRSVISNFKAFKNASVSHNKKKASLTLGK